MAYIRTRHETIGEFVAEVCHHNGKGITTVYLAALTIAGFHDLRKKMAKLINKETGSRHRLGR